MAALKRVAAFKRLFERKAGSPRLFRHQIYAHIAEREPKAWALGFSDPKGESDRVKATKDPTTLDSGSRPNDKIVAVWKLAMEAAFDGLQDLHIRVRGKQPVGTPLGYWTTELSFK